MQSHDLSDAVPSPPHEAPTPRTVPTPPTTGDPVVDAAMVELAEAEAGPLSGRIDAGERAHRVLQERLRDLSDHGGTSGPGGR